jgi:hypothetical protein
MGATDLAQQAVRSQQPQLTCNGGRSAPFFFVGSHFDPELAPQVAIAQAVWEKFVSSSPKLLAYRPAFRHFGCGSAALSLCVKEVTAETALRIPLRSLYFARGNVDH